MTFNYKKKIILICLLIIGFDGCAVVQPWERERLANPDMMFEENPLLKGMEEHYINTKEGSEGGNGSESGGCGCG